MGVKGGGAGERTSKEEARPASHGERHAGGAALAEGVAFPRRLQSHVKIGEHGEGAESSRSPRCWGCRLGLENIITRMPVQGTTNATGFLTRWILQHRLGSAGFLCPRCRRYRRTM